MAKRTARRRPVTEMPPFRPVQLATLAESPPAGPEWIHEAKYDGYRCLLAVGPGAARTYTRCGLDWSNRFQPIIDAAIDLPVSSALIDGEAVVLDADGVSSFTALQDWLKRGAGTLIYYAFDLLQIDGEDIAGEPLIDRKARLRALLGRNRVLRYSRHVSTPGDALLARFCKAGIEGMVSKRRDLAYVGARTDGWIKTRCNRRQEFVIVGWLPSAARGLRSLLLGVRDDGAWNYAGKVGAGFDDAEIGALLRRLEPLRRKTPSLDAPAAAVRNAIWVKPELVAEVVYTEKTASGVLRHPRYLGLRHDKPAEEVVSDKARPARARQNEIAISHPDRLLFPDCGVTKGTLADYYRAVAPLMAPWIYQRPISLVRCPQGTVGKCFFQKHDAGAFGDAVKHVPVREKDGSEEQYLYLDDDAGLLTCVQMGAIEFHGWGACVEDVERPDRLVFDLDPAEDVGFDAVRDAAFDLRRFLETLGLVTFPLATGGKGVHVVAPLTPSAEWPEVKAFALAVARALAGAEPERFTAALSKSKRGGRIFIDYLRNQRGATAILPYSVRARATAPVAVPVSWRELKTLDSPAHWTVPDVKAVVARSRRAGLAGWGAAAQKLPTLTRPKTG